MAKLNVEIADHTRAGADSVKRNLQGISQAAGGLGKQIDSPSKGTAGLGMAMGAMGTSLSVAVVLNYAESWKKVESQLKLVTKGHEDLQRTQGQLMSLSKETTSSFDTTANLYARLARSTEELGLSQAELLTITSTINKAFVVSGASGAEASAAITQLSQGFASGTLRGDELNSVMEQAPRLARALADGIGVGIGQLRQMGEEGQITSDILAHALLGQA